MKGRALLFATMIALASGAACGNGEDIGPPVVDAGAQGEGGDAGGISLPMCVTPQTTCGSRCAFVASDPANCGACDHACPAYASGAASCVDSQCADPGCGHGFSDCNGMPADGCEKNVTAADGANCGACGHSCGGDACASGLCAPRVLAQAGLVAPFAIALAGTDLFIIDRGTDNGAVPDGRILRIPAAGGAPVAIANAQPSPHDIAADATNVYYTSASSVWLVGHDGTCGALGSCPFALATARKNPRAIAIDDTYVYWGEAGLAASQFADGGVYRTTKDGKGAIETVVAPSTQVGAVALGDTDVFFAGKGHVFRAPKTGGLGVSVGDADGGIAIVGATLFIGDASRVTVSQLDGTQQKVIFPLAGATAIRGDATKIFMSVSESVSEAQGDGTCPGAGGCPMKLATLGGFSDVSYSPFVLDATFVYAASPDGRVLRIPR